MSASPPASSPEVAREVSPESHAAPPERSTLASELEDALVNAPPDFLKLLRALNRLTHTRGEKHREVLHEVHGLEVGCGGLHAARELGLLTSDGSTGLTLTALGTQVCDGVKQYVNWLEHPLELPRGVTGQMLRGKRVLDVGCGVGCALLTFGRHGAASLTGVDLIPSFLALCKVFARREGLPAPHLACGTGASVPLKSESFDTVFCRLAFNYMPAAAAVREMARLCRPDADLVIILNLLPWEWRTFLDNVRAMRLKPTAYGLLKFLNGCLYHVTGRQLTLRYPGRMHAVHSPIFHTPRSVRRLLTRGGFRLAADDAADHPETAAFWCRRRAE